MATFTLTTTPGAAYVGTEADDFYFIPSAAAWLAAGRTIDGRGGRDTLFFEWSGASTLAAAVAQQAVSDASFAGVSNVEAILWSPASAYAAGPFFVIGMGPVASAVFPQGVTMGFLLSLSGQGLTVPVTFQGGFSQNTGLIVTGSGNDVIFGEIPAAQIDAGPGDDQVSLGPLSTNPFAGSGSVAGGPGYDVLTSAAFGTITIGSGSTVTGVEEIRVANRLNLLDSAPAALTGLDGGGARNPLVLRPASGNLNVFASDDGRASYDGRIVAFGGAGADTMRGSSVADWLDGGTGGADSLSGEGGNDILVLQNAAHLAGAALVGGGGGYDILALQDMSETLTDAAFARAGGIEELYLLGTGAQRVTFGASSDAAFAASSFGAGSVSAVYASSLIVNASGSSRALSIYGSNGTDTLTGGAGADYIESRTGGDTVDAGAGDDHLYYDARPDNAARLAGNIPGKVGPRLDGGTGYDVVLLNISGVPALASNFAIDTWRNVEELRLVGTGAQTLSVSKDMFVGSITGYATITAPNASSLFMTFVGLTDMGFAIHGTAGNDVLSGNAGRDHLYGGAGSDIFQFSPNRSIDVFADFTSGTDRIQLIGFTDVGNFAAVQARSTVVNGNLQIGLNANDAIILVGVTSIAAGDFIFS